ncbi:DUF1836 domain-containing protein [Limosilactobacillus fastidiosus]|uniref:DUF1836 domain-containing protein n=1 Tax=Limosilactobacillus fastidiosus TaxID=2759855 RepID=A0A7W3TYT9_9LACO|nr:DUF1836 domain-containing protein [Limosilactobacillus fastidiosus]MBB1062695.1 DUF1836 domain-containing protein [Limosilactobacillus fastidiosus]MBB1085793.1 DUF1836 domain-containing protein [Limosilactobacillus fastidiosus]MCD7083935.1 DUF1836 domain-containing protein [Limosilactobacillus fastidiosus]MCD7085870.1 DUF1836 domain-containing protein [Limosilactobacillus fastidiosus]MCD7113947.1 DUF1836 domain-containing protein [Limosilactobacillus fastidiosus]
MTNLTKFKRWENSISRMHFPKWKELPSLGLYVDQVAAVINENLASLGMEPLTKSMINNYVKKKTIQAPIKKKYAVNQIVDLLLIGFFKNTFAIDDIRRGILQITSKDYPKQAYDRFVEILNARLKNEKVPDNPNFDPANEQLMNFGIDAVLASLKARYLLKMMAKESQVGKDNHENKE